MNYNDMIIEQKTLKTSCYRNFFPNTEMGTVMSRMMKHFTVMDFTTNQAHRRPRALPVQAKN